MKKIIQLLFVLSTCFHLNAQGCKPPHIAFIIDESSSIMNNEVEDVKNGLISFINQEVDEGITLSIVGMSNVDDDIRTDHILNRELTPATKDSFLTEWINFYRRRAGTGLNGGSDHWASGLKAVNEMAEVPDIVIMITDGSDDSEGTVDEIKSEINILNSKSHLFIIGIKDGFYLPIDGDEDLQTSLNLKLNRTAIRSNSTDDLLTADFIDPFTFSDLSAILTNLPELIENSNVCGSTCSNYDIDGSFEFCFLAELTGDNSSSSFNTCDWNIFGSSIVSGPYPINNDVVYITESPNLGRVVTSQAYPINQNFSTELTGLIPGSLVKVKFYQFNATKYNPDFNNDPLRWQVKLGSAIANSSPMPTEVNPLWKEETVEFVANSTSETLIFTAIRSDFSATEYAQMHTAIDGIEIIIQDRLEGQIIVSGEVICANAPITFNFNSLDIPTADNYVWYFYEQGTTPPINGISTTSPSITYTFPSPLTTYDVVLEVEIDGCVHMYYTEIFTQECNIDPPGECDDCYSFKPIPGENYVLSAWVKENVEEQARTYANSNIEINFLDGNGATISTISSMPNGRIIDEWQRIYKEFSIPSNSDSIEIVLNNVSETDVFFDDIRIHPFNGSMKSFVYDPITQRLMAELDENNYSTFYEYDNEGGLIRVKKETVKGVYTIQETRSKSSTEED